MARDIYELDKLSVVALLQKGKPAGSAVEFIFKKDGAELQKVKGEIVSDPGARTGKAATCKFDPPEVPPDKPSYLLEYTIKVDTEEISDRSQFTVWPKKGKVATHHDADDKAFPGFKVKVLQNGKPQGNPYATTGDPAIVEFKLEKGFPFTIDHVAPYEIKTMAKNGSALRDLKAKGVLHFTAEFVAPVPKKKKLKQWVNLPATAKKGQDGLGNKILFQVGVKGDRGPDGKTKPDAIGKAGMTVFVKVKFGPDPGKSKRNDPKTELLAGGNASAITAVTANVEYTAKVDLAKAGGVGEFEVDLGYAGGDTCEVSIGSTAAATDAKVTVTNWRKVYYELLAPDFMALSTVKLKDGTSAKNIPRDGRKLLTDEGVKTFIEFELVKFHKFAKDKGAAGTILPRTFIKRTSGPADVYVLTDKTFSKNPIAFEKAKSPTGCIKFCDSNIFSDGSPTDAPVTKTYTAKSAAPKFALGSVIWIPKSGSDETDTVKSIKWKAKFPDANAGKARPAVDFEADANRDDPDTKVRTITVKETLQNKTVDIQYKNPAIGHVPTDLDATRKGALDTFFNSLYTVPALKSKGNKLKFKLTGLTGDDRRTTRFQVIKDYLNAKVAAAAKIPFHPGLDDAGNPREAALTLAAIDMTKSDLDNFVLKLDTSKPESPGSLANDTVTDTQCPVSVEIKFEPHHAGLGLASGGEILVVYDKDNPISCADTFLHEFGHQFNMTSMERGARDMTATPQVHKWPTSDATHAPGLPVPKTVVQAETTADYVHNGTLGHYYVEKGHSGPHCAWGLDDADKALPHYDSAANPALCIMIGASNPIDSTRTKIGFCPQCVEYAKGRDLRTLK